LSSSFSRYPFSLGTYLKSMNEAITSGLRIKQNLSSKFNIDSEKIIYVPHHISHAAHSYLGSGYKEAAILTVDAVGEWTCTAILKGENGKITPLDAVFFPHSLGLIYSTFTAYLGFKANDGECSTMALAAFGEPLYADVVRDIIQVEENGKYKINMDYFNFGSDVGLPITNKFLKAFGAPRNFKEPLPFDCLSDEHGEIDSNAKRFADIAASVQTVLEEALIALVKYTKKLTNCDKLCFSGGVALNAVANSKILRSQIFEDVFIPPDPGDGGGAMGAAMFVSSIKSGGWNSGDFKSIHPYFGKSFNEEEILKIINQLDLKRVRQFTKSKREFKIEIEKFLNFDEMALNIAKDIVNQKIVGWVQSRFENGPRALGNRSILCSPSSIDVARKISKEIKLRASFRPYALSVSEEDASKVILELRDKNASKWMQTSAQTKKDVSSKIRAAIHYDGTTRPQICSEKDNSKFHTLLKKIGTFTGLEGVLNTSFNESGYPLVSGPNEAFLMFIRTDIDVLVINNTVIRRVFINV
jgi:carbamoyltransferase